MYPKQPFDFAGKTGTVSFDVSNDTQGTHAAWPEFWLTDIPVPTPFNHFNSWHLAPEERSWDSFCGQRRNRIVRLCPNGNNLDKRRLTVDSAVVVRNYAYEDVGALGLAFAHPAGGTGMKVNVLDCVVSAARTKSGP